MFRSSTKNTKCFPRGGPNTPLRLTKKDNTIYGHYTGAKEMEGVGVGRLHITETVFCRLQPSQPSLRLFGVGQFYIVQLVFKSLQNMSVMI